MAKVIDINMHQLKNLCRYKIRLKDAAAFFEVDESTIERRIKEHYGNITFAEFREKNQVKTRFALMNTALDMAINDKDRIMLIFCLKNLCGWTNMDTPPVEEETAEETPALKYAVNE